ncbi:partner of Y14 and mago isoform X2 [Folsomia candida]|uniref:partner of Y14 and mago isoform X2 n=1 Tax=Folsomia candida TaxID=158441 RepID=UPI000B905662|nr:partner of Y14 and mago isoform X2 [Folsomia candida]
MSSMQVVKDDDGKSFIPPSQRPDGTWRKPIRVRSGYVPQEEQPVYVSKGRGVGEKNSYPVGLSANDVGGGGGISSFPVGYFDSVEMFRQSAGIPGLNFVAGADPLVPTKTKSKSKKKGAAQTATATPAAAAAPNSKPSSSSSSSTPKPSSAGMSATAASTSSTSNSSQGADPSKRLRNLKKRLKEIEDLEKRIASGELTAPEKEQLEKLKRKDEVEDEIEDLERQIANLNFS